MEKEKYIKPSIMMVETKMESLLQAASQSSVTDYAGGNGDLGLNPDIPTLGDDDASSTSNAPRRSIWGD